MPLIPPQAGRWKIPVAAALLVAAHVARAAQPPVSITIAGGVSLGSYEAGLVHYMVEAMRLNPGAAATPKIVTGASAGSVNAFLTILQSCGAAVPDPTASLLWRTWIPLGLARLQVPGKGQSTSAFSRDAFTAPLELVETAWNAGLPESCDAVLGISVTRLVPRIVTTEGVRLRLPRVEEHFVLRIQGRGAGRPPRLTNYVDPAWRGEQALMPEGDGEVPFSDLRDALFASTAFPAAFPPQPVRHCVVRGSGTTPLTCPAAQARADLFVDGGVFDNTPVRLATRVAAAGLRMDGDGEARWIDVPDLAVRALPPSLVVAHVSTEARTFPEATEEARPEALQTLLGVTAQVAGSFVTTARAKNLLYVHDDAPDVFGRLIVPERHLPAASSPLAAFFGFVETELRRFDFVLGMYDARRLTEAHIGAQPASAGARGSPRFPEDSPETGGGSSGWRRYRCLRAILDGAPEAQDACAGEDLRDFRIVLQTSLERLWDACARLDRESEAYGGDPLCRRARLGEPVMPVPFVGALGGERWRRRANENDVAFSMRLLVAHRFRFEDLGLSPEDAEKAPAVLRARLLKIGEAVSRAQPLGEDVVVLTAVKIAADQVAYVPPRFTIWALYGRDPEIGISGGFPFRRALVAPLRFHAAVEFVGTEALLSSEHGHYVGAVVVGAEFLPSSWADTRLQPSLLLRAGWLFSSNDDGGFASCADPEDDLIGACSRPTLQGGVSATVLEGLRLQVSANWYLPARAGQVHQWAIAPAIGFQWAF